MTTPDPSTPAGEPGPLLTIWTPATSANLGPGFDSIGLALDFGMSVEVHPAEGETPGTPAEWRVELLDEALGGLPTDEENLVVRTALDVAGAHGVTLSPRRLLMRSEIPLVQGLGSSAAAIVTGAELANVLGGLGLTKDQLLVQAVRLEGHPDNVAPAIFGGLVISVGAVNEHAPAMVRAGLPVADVILVIPDYRLPTEKARTVLPPSLDYWQAVEASARSNVLVAALLSGDWRLAGMMMEKDLFHEPFRAFLVPELERVRQVVRRAGAYGAAISGAGPTVISFAPVGSGPAVALELRRELPRADVRVVSAGSRGVTSGSLRPGPTISPLVWRGR